MTQCIVDNNVAILFMCYCLISSYLGICCHLGALRMNVLLPTRSSVDLGSRGHGGSKFQGKNCLMWFLSQGNLYFSSIGSICPTGSAELNKYLLGKLLCTVGSYFPGVSTILTLILIITGPLSSTFARASDRIRQPYAEGSRCSYYNKFNILLSFCNHYKLNVKRLMVNNCISFL